MRRHRYRQLESMEFVKKILLFFLIGFFIGGFFYYLFQYSFADISKIFEENMTLWSGKKVGIGTLLWQSLWQHGKYFLLFLIFAIGPLAAFYQKAFSLYTGIRNGFLFLFFLFAKGIYGFVVYFLSLIPHCALLAPLYLYAFGMVNKKRQKKQQVFSWFCLLLVFVAACFLEVKINLPMMESILHR